jgi:16S rRNA (uracil1498-N3)-methyltransferase
MECLIVEKRDVDLDAMRLVLRGDEGHHAAKVLRLRTGEHFLATDLEGTSYRASYQGSTQTGKHEIEVVATIEAVLPEHGESGQQIELVIGFLAQPARWEFLLEKATELGVSRVTPIASARTEKRVPKLDRSERILRAAVKQTKRSRMPELSELSTLSEALGSAAQEGRAVYILHEAASKDDLLMRKLQSVGARSVTLVIGPEGGFSDEEVSEAVSLGAQVASLGERRLRAETAAIAALAIAQSFT